MLAVNGVIKQNT